TTTLLHYIYSFSPQFFIFHFFICFFFFFHDPPPTAFYTLSLHDALPISFLHSAAFGAPARRASRARSIALSTTCQSAGARGFRRSEEHTSELQSLRHLVCRLLLEKKKKKNHREQ